MKVTCQRDGLLTACQLVSAAVAARTTQPVLSNVKATAEDDRLVLVGRDAETVGIRYELRGIDVARGRVGHPPDRPARPDPPREPRRRDQPRRR